MSNVTCDHDDQVIDQRGSSRMGELHKVLAALLDYIGPDVCDQVVSEGIEKAASIAAEMINNPARWGRFRIRKLKHVKRSDTQQLRGFAQAANP